MKSGFDRLLILLVRLTLSLESSPSSTRFLLRIPRFPVGAKNCKNILRLSFRAHLMATLDLWGASCTTSACLVQENAHFACSSPACRVPLVPNLPIAYLYYCKSQTIRTKSCSNSCNSATVFSSPCIH